MSSFSIILPAYNEEPGIAAVLQSIRAAYPEAELIVVDDCSTDTTAAIAIQNGAKLIRHTLNLGAGKSVKDGVEQAFFDRIIMMDSDGTYPVDSIPALLAELDLGYNLVVGARHGYAYNGRILKRMARFVFRCLAEFATGKRIPDINSGMRAFRRSEILPYFPHLCNGFSLPTTMTLAYFFTGMKVRYVPIQYSKRFGHTKVKIIRDSADTPVHGGIHCTLQSAQTLFALSICRVCLRTDLYAGCRYYRFVPGNSFGTADFLSGDCCGEYENKIGFSLKGIAFGKSWPEGHP
jgi:glycosyltransferase involved in cell wall biosynthesis